MTPDRVKSFLLPDLGEGLEDATVVAWHVQVGDEIALNEPLCSLETAKAEVEIPSPFGGRVVETRGAEGDVLEVGSLLARIDTEPAGDAPAGGSNGATVPQGTDRRASHGFSVLVGSGPDDALDDSRRPPEHRPNAESSNGRPRAAPPVRKLAAELAVDLADIQPGSGPGGLILREDVLAAAHPEPRPTAPSRDHEVVPVRRAHARMAERMTRSRTEIPDAHASVHVDCSKLLNLRDRLNAAAGDTVTPFVLSLRLIVVALTRNMIFNSTWSDTVNGPQIHTHRAIHLGIGVATPRGLLVPVVPDAHACTTLQLAATVSELIRTAREGVIKPTELQGSTFTVSNFGALGLDEGVPVINHPECAILGMGSLRPRAVVVDDQLAIRPTMMLTCAFDHRIADGAQLAKFLCDTRDLIESPEMALLDL
ncbi:dihydrolipoamide acetyltransferase family protein [Mycobacterium sp. CPCC 205372]|uniref:Dihydrolipoamide acetyltransferase component of pyruvate dehydrogenase complex n=1 Tax=Mycobacterium hippophais TaxID=3016340 RepID=A0ABT4PS06_9MYCO|nr:dihydrolipoamide acetyltransferase family protein [Mycobacterium hippophais]MCZ8379284.1 dihydrolipoamide acetyltransferase family protein [Mycobacterium hippophais]